jgi:DNA polymerase
MFTNPCDTCPRKHRAIGGSGPQPARILAIAERPGPRENERGEVLVGPTGQEWDELYLPLAGLDRSEIRVCNTVMCWADSNKTPTDKEIQACAPCHVPDEIERTNPDTIILMGATACALVPGIRLDMHHGIPQHTRKVGGLFGWSGWLIPMFHPSIGLHESRFMQVCMEDWQGLHMQFADAWHDDPEPELTNYRHASVALWMLGKGPLGVDTESHAGKPWSVQVSAKPGTGMLFRCNDSDAMGFLKMWMPQHEVIMHNAAYDLEVLRHLGIGVTSFRDTMQEAFALGNLPQGLKALTYRLFRHTMTSYEETVRPASIRALLDWMTEAYQIAVLDLTYVSQRFSPKTGKRLKDETTKSDLESLLTRLLRLTTETSEYDPWGSEKEPRLDAFWHEPVNEWMVQHVEARIGAYPLLGIANCSMEEAVRYAVGDADWTGRVAVELQRRRQGAFQIYEGDRDA